MSFAQDSRNGFGTGRVERRRLDIGQVVRQTFDALGRNIVPFLILALLLAGLPTLLVALVAQGSTFAAAGHVTTGVTMRTGLISIVGGLISLALLGVFQAAIVFGVVNDLNGRRSTINELLSTGLRFALPAVAISLVYGIVMGLGFVLLIVPGLIVATAWIVALPAEVVERSGIMAAFSRSGELVQGNRWRILVLLVIYALAASILNLALLALTGGIVPHAGATLTIVQNMPRLLISAVLRSLSYMVAAVGVAVIYQDLRSAREGVAPADLAAVFD